MSLFWHQAKHHIFSLAPSTSTERLEWSLPLFHPCKEVDKKQTQAYGTGRQRILLVHEINFSDSFSFVVEPLHMRAAFLAAAFAVPARGIHRNEPQHLLGQWMLSKEGLVSNISAV